MSKDQKEVEVISSGLDFELCFFFERQVAFQREYENIDRELKLPADDQSRYAKNLLLFFEEIGELLQEDKRWRGDHSTFRKAAKKRELADVFIVFMNLLIYSGWNLIDLLEYVGFAMDNNDKKLDGKKNDS